MIPLQHFTGWLANGERGISSEAIVSRLTGVRVGRPWFGSDWPHDPDDFRRCELLFERVPLARLAFPMMRDASPQWGRLVDAWDEIRAAIEAEAPEYLRGRGRTPRAYRLMDRIIHDGVPCERCEGAGTLEDCPKCKGSGRRSGGRCRPCWGRGRIDCKDCRGRGYTAGGAA